MRILVGALVTGAIHFIVWWRLVKPARLPRRAHLAITGAMLLLWLLMVVRPPALTWLSMMWMPIVGLSLVAVAVLELSRLVAWLGARAVRKRPSAVSEAELLSRRKFLARVGSGAAVTVVGTSVAGGVVQARGAHEIVDVEIVLPKLPKALDGFSIVQLSDLHVGLTIDRAFVQRVVDHTNRLSPDLVVLTGDLVDGTVEDLFDDISPLGSLRAKHGVYSVTGNHEYYAGADPWIAALTKLGVRYLRNEMVAIGDAEASFHLAGVDDHGAHRWRGHGEDLARATAGRDPNRALVLLAHQPRQVRRAQSFGVDLQLSGHTHGGQVWPWHYLVKVQQGGLLAGRYQFGDTQLYVTRGCGYWGPPVRLLAPLEITRVILRSV